MEEQNFNPVIEAVVSIRHLATASVNNWNAMNKISNTLKTDIEKASNMINLFASGTTKEAWLLEMTKYNKSINSLKSIMSEAIDKIKNKKAENISKNWDEYPTYTACIEQNYMALKKIGASVLPENEKLGWDTLWVEINKAYTRIKLEAKACSMQLKMIEEYSPEDIDELTDTILKHMPIHYSKEEALNYSDEYIKAFNAIKNEASQKKNFWDRFLDILAGGTQQSPAQRVMMQRWVDGEKGDAH